VIAEESSGESMQVRTEQNDQMRSVSRAENQRYIYSDTSSWNLASVGTLRMLQLISPSSPQTSPWHCPRKRVVDHECAEEIDPFLDAWVKERRN
jgi:hypothetical protein